MSVVDNVILSFSIQEDFVEDTGRYVLVRGRVEVDLMDRINAWTREHAGQEQEFGPDLGSFDRLQRATSFPLPVVVGGAKPLETPVFVAAFNYLPLDDFMEFLRSLPWYRPGSVQVIVKRQQGDVFEILTIDRAAA